MKKINIKKQKNAYIRNEKGSITLFTTISMIFFLIIVTALYINSNNNNQKQNKEIQKIQEQYTEDINEIYEKALQANKQFLRDVVEVGDYVKYKVDTASTTELITELGTYSGSTANTTTTLTQETDLNWRVLDIVRDENGKDCVRLISGKPTVSTVALRGYNGYNNAVYLLDKICNTLYNNSKYAKKVQNLKIEDIEKYMVTKPVYSDETSSPPNLYYPNILIQERNQTVNGRTGVLSFSEQTDPINQIETQEVVSWSLKMTYWSQAMKIESFENGYYNLFINDGESNYETYWMSSRCINLIPNTARFIVRNVSNGGVYANDLYYSYDEYDEGAFALRPVVTLNSDILIDSEKSGDGSEAGKEYVLK